MAESGYSETLIKTNLENSWVWRNIVVAPTDEEAASRGIPAFKASSSLVQHARENLNNSQELESILPDLNTPDSAWNTA